jgi:antitoxin component YwqK of YwqJK toxin-antitoxin module
LTKKLIFIILFLFLFSGYVYGEEPEVKRDYYDSDKLKCETYYKNGVPDGLPTDWYRNGIIEYSKRYKNEKLEGMKTEWYESGKKKSTSHYKNGIEN